jgi:hypothetical protein
MTAAEFRALIEAGAPGKDVRVSARLREDQWEAMGSCVVGPTLFTFETSAETLDQALKLLLDAPWTPVLDGELAHARIISSDFPDQRGPIVSFENALQVMVAGLAMGQIAGALLRCGKNPLRVHQYNKNGMLIHTMELELARTHRHYDTDPEQLMKDMLPTLAALEVDDCAKEVEDDA